MAVRTRFDWLIYLVLAAGLIFAAKVLRENANAPAAPPPVPGEAAVPLDPALPFDPVRVVRTSAPPTGAAFSVSAKGVWLTARDAVDGCHRPGLIIATGRAVEAEIEIVEKSGVAVLTTKGGAPPLALASRSGLADGARGFALGYVGNRPGEAAVRLIGEDRAPAAARGAASYPALAWAETGRTDGLGGALTGMVGAPVLDISGRVTGVLLRDEPRRGMVLATPPTAVALAVAASREEPAGGVQPITVATYGRVADDVRRALSVVRVTCLER